jgi:uncharacterized protein (TIGR00369 family)
VNIGEGAPARPGRPAVSSGPEKYFGIGRSTAEGGEVMSSMSTGPWLRGPAGQPLGGTVGVLIDDVLGLAIIRQRPAGRWSVSAEISLDLVAPLPADGGRLACRGRLMHAGAHGGIASGTVTDAAGQVIALCGQHSRWVAASSADPEAHVMASGPRDPSGAPPAAAVTAVSAGAGSLAELLHARVQATEGGAELGLTVTADLVNPLGNLHGGITFAACDLVAQVALLAAGGPTQTASIRVAYPRPIPLGATPEFQARLLHRGRGLGIVAVTVTTDDAKPRALATVTTGPAG